MPFDGRRFCSAVALALLLSSHAALAQVSSPVESMSWLTGCWAAEGGEPGSGEHWTAPAGGTMLGLSRTVKGGKTVAFEFMQIRVNSEGRLVYIALPSGQSETTFVVTAQSEGTTTFENLAHDFPQRIIYSQQPQQQRLVARIEGSRAGRFRAIEFPMRRMPCEAPGAVSR